MNQFKLLFFCLAFLFSNVDLSAQNTDCPYPIIFLHGFTGNQESFEDVYNNANFIATYGPLADIYHAVLNANSSTNIWGNDGIKGTKDDDVLFNFNNESNDLASGCVYAINFNNAWNGDENNPILSINGCDAPGFFESDSNESAILKGGYALGNMIQKVLEANPTKDKVILVGHSMGGLTSREYLQRTEGGSPRWWVDPSTPDGHKVAKLVTTATPHRGSNFFGNPWSGFSDNSPTDQVAQERDGFPDLFSEATRDLRYNFSCGFLNLFTCTSPYLWGGDEDDVSGYWNEDVDCNGNESSIVIGINQAGSDDAWNGTRDNPAMPLPSNIRYTWIRSDIVFDDGDGVVALDRQWLYVGSTPVPSDGVAHRLTDLFLTDRGHLSVNSDFDVVVQGLDEGDYPKFATKISLDNLTGGIAQVRSGNAPEGPNTTDPDWYAVDIPASTVGDINLTFNPHPSMSGRIDFFSITPSDYMPMSGAGELQATFVAGAPTVSMTIAEGSYSPGGKHFFRVIHENIGTTDWHLEYNFELTVNAPLPVELTFFEGKKADDFVDLNWATAAEFNSDKFEILRSHNGIDYKQIGIVKAQGFSESYIDYSFTDRQPLAGNNYYRLRQIDFDGKVSFSNIVILHFEKDQLEIHKVYPNPARQQISLEFFAYSNKAMEINVFNMVGQLVKTQTLQVEPGNNKTQLDIRNLLDGVYLVQLSQGRISQHIKITKQ